MASETQIVVADFGNGQRAVVDEQDYEALQANRYRRLRYGNVVRSVEGRPGDWKHKGNRSLFEDVAERMGIDLTMWEPRPINGNTLDARRANVKLCKRRTYPPRQNHYVLPPGYHRRRGEARGPESAAPGMHRIVRHEQECVHPESCRAPGQRLIGTARVLTRTTRSGREVPAGWQATYWRTKESRDFRRYDEAVWWLEAQRLDDETVRREARAVRA